MDLIKTLLLYMLMATSGAAGVTGATPVPYDVLHTPTPIVTPSPTPSPTPDPTPTPSPSPTPTPQLYTLAIGSAGGNVRTLQAKLKELGYLSDEPDGNYGKRTAAAVEWFQQVNGLDVDGVAGKKTLQKLYFDENVLPAPQNTPAP